MMSNIIVFLTNEEKPINNTMINPAPNIAPSMVVINSPTMLPKSPCINPPAPSVIIATPMLAPVETPRIDGPANGF